MQHAFPVGASVTVAELEDDPHHVLARLRREEPVSWLPCLGAWLVTRRDLAQVVMRDDAGFTVDDPRFSTARVVGPSMLSTDGASHTRHRDPFAPAFRRDRVHARFGAPVRELAAALVRELAPSGAAELRRGFAGPLAVAVMARALGLEHVEAPRLLAWYDAIVDAVSAAAAGVPIGDDARAAYAALADAVAPAAAAEPSASILASARAASDLTGVEIASNAAVLLFGGVETVEGMITTLALHVLSAPGVADELRADPSLLPAAVDESLRLEPAAAGVDRYATADRELGGAPIRRGDLVSVSLAGANRDPATFPDPDRFDPRRRDLRLHLAFAQGPHVCLGMHLARLEAAAALGALLDGLPGLRLDPAAPPPAVRGLVFRKPPVLHVAWDS